MLAQLNLNEYFVDELAFVANHDHVSSGTRTAALDMDFDISRNPSKPLEFMISMTVDINRRDEDFQNSDYRVHLKLTGFFSFTDGTTEETISSMIAPNGLSILYGVARGTVANATATSWNGKFVLPAMNLTELIKQKAEAVTKTQKPTRKLRKKHT